MSETPQHVIETGEPLPLQGRAVREYLWVDVYRLGVYFAEDASLHDLLRHPAEVAVRIEIMAEQLPSEPPPAWAEVFRDHLSPRLSEKLMRQFAELAPGDVLWFVHDLSGDSRITINRDEFAVATGYGLMRSMLRLWLGAEPVSPALREEIIDKIDE